MRLLSLRNNVVILMADNSFDRKVIGDLMFEPQFIGNQMCYINEHFMFENKSMLKTLINYLEHQGCDVAEDIEY